MNTDIQRQGSSRKQASESDRYGDNECNGEKKIFQPANVAIERGARGKHREEVIEKGQSRPGHDDLIRDSESSQQRWDSALEERRNREETAKKQRQQPSVEIIGAQQ